MIDSGQECKRGTKFTSDNCAHNPTSMMFDEFRQLPRRADVSCHFFVPNVRETCTSLVRSRLSQNEITFVNICRFIELLYK